MFASQNHLNILYSVSWLLSRDIIIMYYLMWNNEIIDSTDNYRDACYLQGEYQMAYGGIVDIVEEG